MGQHTLRRASGISTTTGRAIFTGIAALGLVSSGAGMAFAGEASTSSSDHDVKGDHDDEGDHDGDHDKSDGHDKDDDGHGKKHHKKKHHDKHDEKPEECEIPVYADASRATDSLVNDLTDDATKPANDATAAAAKPIDDAICAEFAPLFYEADEELGHGPKDDYKYQGESPSGLADPSKH